MSKTLLILNERDIQRLNNNEHVACPLRNTKTNEYEGMIVILSEICYKAYFDGEYDVEKVEEMRRINEPNNN